MWARLFLVFAATLLLSSASGKRSARTPPEDMPDELEADFTMNGRVALERLFVDDTNGGKGTHYGYSRQQFEALISQMATSLKQIYENILFIKSRVPDVSPSVLYRKMKKTQWVALACLGTYFDYIIKTGDVLVDNVVKDAKVAVFGSQEPWVEAMVLALGAETVTVLEYNRLDYQHEAVRTVSLEGFDSFFSDAAEIGTFDVAFSISSFDHSGLGRYNDPIDPDGDMNYGMNRAMQLLKDGGLLYLTVPIGPDKLIWNLMRVYGPVRLPVLLQGWEVVERVGWEEDRLSAQSMNVMDTYEPVFVLRKSSGGGSPLMNEEL